MFRGFQGLPNNYNFGILVSTYKIVCLSRWVLDDSENTSHWEFVCCMYAFHFEC